MQSFAGTLPLFLKGIKDEKVALIFLKELWPEVVGPVLARRIRPINLRSGTLLLRIPDPVWEGQMKHLSSMIIRSINKYWNKEPVTRIEMDLAD